MVFASLHADSKGDPSDKGDPMYLRALILMDLVAGAVPATEFVAAGLWADRRGTTLATPSHHRGAATAGPGEP
jgi:hypothetical protein